jgi:hypothetical protein
LEEGWRGKGKIWRSRKEIDEKKGEKDATQGDGIC